MTDEDGDATDYFGGSLPLFTGVITTPVTSPWIVAFRLLLIVPRFVRVARFFADITSRCSFVRAA